MLGIAALLIRLGSAHVTDWSRDGEFLIDTNVVYFPDTNSQYKPSIAFDSSNYLVVWEDDRNDVHRDIYGARVDKLGNVLDPIAIAVSTAQDGQWNPAIAFDGTNYLVVWKDRRSDSSQIYGARVSQSGQVLDTSGIVIFSNPSPAFGPSVAFGSTNYLVVWSFNGNIRGFRVNHDGVVLDSIPIVVSAALRAQVSPKITFDGTNYFVIWEDFRNDPTSWYSDIYGARVSQEGIVLDPSGISIGATAHGQMNPSLAFGDTMILVTWLDNRLGLDWDIYGARVSLDGNVLDPSGIPITASPVNEDNPAVSFDDTDFIVVWNALGEDMSDNIYGAKVSPSGAIIDTFSISLQAGDQIKPAITRSDGDQLMITYCGWTDFVGGNYVNTMRIWGKFFPFVGLEEDEMVCLKQNRLVSTIIKGPMLLPEDKQCKVYNITGRFVEPDKIQPGIYFIEIDGVITQKVVKVR
jgi:hypothetical protein